MAAAISLPTHLSLFSSSMFIVSFYRDEKNQKNHPLLRNSAAHLNDEQTRFKTPER